MAEAPMFSQRRESTLVPAANAQNSPEVANRVIIAGPAEVRDADQ